jgi:DNA-3-methyladenine glycosylase
MRDRRVRARGDRELTSGPARLTQALGITGTDDGADLTRGAIRILDDDVPPPSPPTATRRIGIRAGHGDEHPWRWLVASDPNVSRSPQRRQ